jgi:hypothetical protein
MFAIPLADIRKARRLLGFAPSHRIEQGLDAALEWYRANLVLHGSKRARAIGRIALWIDGPRIDYYLLAMTIHLRSVSRFATRSCSAPMCDPLRVAPPLKPFRPLPGSSLFSTDQDLTGWRGGDTFDHRRLLAMPPSDKPPRSPNGPPPCATLARRKR